MRSGGAFGVRPPTAHDVPARLPIHAKCRIHLTNSPQATTRLFTLHPPLTAMSTRLFTPLSLRPFTAAVVTTFALAAAPALADSTSSASSAASTSVGSSSTSLNTSSNSSSGKERVAQGPYTVLAMTTVAQQPDLLQLHLQSAATTDGTAASEFTLTLPRAAVEREQLAVGHTVLAQHRPYGLAFATLGVAGQARPFFLVLDDSWHRELHNQPLGG